MSARLRPGVELALLAAAALAPLLPPPWSAVALAALAALYLLRRPAGRDALVVGPLFGLALLALLAGWAAGLRQPLSRDEWVAVAQARYRAFWDELRAEAGEAAALVARPPADPTARLRAFRDLDQHARGHDPSSRASLLLVDPDGEPVAWAGEGLLHEPAPQELPAAGLVYRASFAAATLAAVHPLPGDERRPWRVVAGRSLPTHRWPFRPPRQEPREGVRWSLAPAGATVPPGAVRLSAAGAPSMLVERPPRLAWTEPLVARHAPRVAWAAIGLALLALAVLRGIGIALLARTVVRGSRRPLEVALLAAAGVLAWALAAGVRGPALATVPAAALLAGLGLRRVRRRAGGIVRAAGQGALAALGLAAAAWAFQAWRGPVDLASAVAAPAEALVLRLAFGAAAFGLLCLAGVRSAPGDRRGDFWAWLAVGFLLAAAALQDWPAAAWLPLAAGGACAAAWLERGRALRRVAPAAAGLLVAALLAAAAWEGAFRFELRRAVQAALPRVAPPTPAETAAMQRQLEAFFAGFDVAALTPVTPATLDRQDLAFAIWRASPLARRNALSALAVRAPGREPSSFSFGLPLRAGAELDRDPARWEEIALPVWDGALVAGTAPVRAGGRLLGEARYWLLPRPGVRFVGRLERFEAGLLRGEPTVRAVEGLPPTAVYALYAGGGAAVRVPWKEAPPLAAALRTGGAARVATPAGAAWAYATLGPDGVEVLYLPALGPTAALDRAGTHALGALLLAGAAALLALVLGLPRAAFRDVLRRAVRSYSKRLIIVYTLLLLVPLLLLSVVLVRGLEERLRREQRAAGEADLDSAQRVLGEYVLTLEPGFGIGTALDDELLVWLSRVVRHELNLYWGSGLYASSKRELFTAGLLPRRIPGEIYARLAILGYEIASRTNRAGETAYLEMYEPLAVPGVRGPHEGLSLSMPLLAQQEEVAAEVAYLRRQALLGTAALFLLLVAVGTRLARNFTRPLMELVRGTQRIAAGATSLGLKPSELELAALVEAVDRMALRIAEARDKLVREKQVVERMVENIDSAIVSLDADRRVLMHNRLAAEMLGVEVGQPLQRALAGERLQPVAAFVGRAGGEPSQATVRVRGEAGEREWTLLWVPVPGPGEPAALLVVEDATEVLRGQRLQAWAEMARIIAHEIKNPLTPIRLSAEHMREVWATDPQRFAPVFERCTANILRQVEDLREIAAEFSTYSRIPRIEPQPGDLVTAVAEVVEGYRAAPPPGIEVGFAADPPAVPARFDARLLGRAVRNLLENALRASGGGGRVEVRVEGDGQAARIVVADRGPGVAPELLQRIFDPYFSTHDAGTGLGLPIARRIAEEHGGRVSASNRPGGGLEVVISLPRQ